MSGSRTAPRDKYPEPISVLTTTVLAFREGEPNKLLLVELQKPDAQGKRLVLPGEIFEGGTGRHRSQRTLAINGLAEETGLTVPANRRPIHIAISQRLNVDPRQWCSFLAINGACDYIMAAPVEGKIKPQDKNEVRRASFFDLDEIPFDEIGRGHDLIIRLWQKIVELQMLWIADPWTGANKAALRSLSNDRHVVDVEDGFGHMIYLEDRFPIVDARLETRLK